MASNGLPGKFALSVGDSRPSCYVLLDSFFILEFCHVWQTSWTGSRNFATSPAVVIVV